MPGSLGAEGLLVLDLPGRPPWWQMALDEALLEYVGERGDVLVVRFYTFSPSSVTIGFFQSLEKTVDLEAAREMGVPVVRRFTGGGAVYHDERGELTYSVAAPARGELSDLLGSYQLICSAIARGLRRLGVEAAYNEPNGIVVGGRKGSGNAQARRRGALLQHGTMLVDPDIEAMERLLRVPGEKLRSHGARRLGDRVTSLSRELGRAPGRLEVAEAVAEALAEALGVKLRESWYPREVLAAAERLAWKYRSPQWNRRR